MKFSVNTFAVIFAFTSVASATVIDLGRRQTDRCSVSNPVVIAVSANKQVDISAQAHARNLQQMTVVPGHAGSTTVVFQGTGEDVPMPIVIGGSGNGLSIPAQTTAYQLTLVFAYSTDSGNSFHVPTVLCPIETDTGELVIATVTSEDASDNDDNDTSATVVFSSPSS